MMIGTRLTGDVFEKKLTKMMEKSETGKSLKKLIKKLDEFQEAGKMEGLLENVTKFFNEATELVSSPEAKNFFRNITELMKELSSEEKVELKLPEKKEVKK